MSEYIVTNRAGLTKEEIRASIEDHVPPDLFNAVVKAARERLDPQKGTGNAIIHSDNPGLALWTWYQDLVRDNARQQRD